MSFEIIDKCLCFCESKRGAFTMNGVKGENFPHNLLAGTPTQQKIMSLAGKGIPTRLIAEQLNCTQPTVMKHIEYYEKSKLFHGEWLAFWAFIKPLRGKKIDIILCDVLTPKEIEQCKKKGIETVGDWLVLYTTNTIKMAGLLSVKLTRDRKSLVFETIKKEAVSLLTVSK